MSDRTSAVRKALEHAAHYLPTQGPLDVFIHHNTLHAFEHLPFFEAVEAGAMLYGCRPYLGSEPAPRPKEDHGHDAVAADELLAAFCGAFLDQGVASWPMPRRDRGFFAAFVGLHKHLTGPGSLRRRLGAECAKLEREGTTAEACLLASLEGVPEAEWDGVLTRALLSLRGWAGMLRFLEKGGGRPSFRPPEGSLAGFAAARLLLDRLCGVERRPALARAPKSWDRARARHLESERRFRDRVLDALALHERRPAERPRFQAVFCIDEREESLRRHLEESAPDVETFAIAGFYFVPMSYRGAGDASFAALCPAVMKPTHRVIEEPARRPRVGSRLARLLATLPMGLRVLFPKLAGRTKKAVASASFAIEPTRLDLGAFTVEEMANIGERVLRDLGLTKGFASIVATLGHGSTSLNNPHESAHDCGACGGSRGGPNGRAIAAILNDARVRETLAGRGIAIPATTKFVGGMHDTSDGTVTFYDAELLPPDSAAEFKALRERFTRALGLDAVERCRRFASAPLGLSPAQARAHVAGRAEDLAQVRPEWGHATNAFCIVGRRERTRGLYLDRRAFLNSYDPGQDDARGTILERELQAVIPVCAGISLEYYFSRVDNAGYGCGTKLPHNVAGLLGVLDGASGDLRTGLPWQMVEIHEPVRILFVIECAPRLLLDILARNPGLDRLARNGWIQLATLAPETQDLRLYEDGAFVKYEPGASALPRVGSSTEWFAGKREHLEFAEVGR